MCTRFPEAVPLKDINATTQQLWQPSLVIRQPSYSICDRLLADAMLLPSRQPSSLRLTGCADPNGGVAVVLGAEPSPAHQPLLLPWISQQIAYYKFCYYHYYYHYR